ncbi:hypothetical protein R1flu_001020 [Riccia fluitans]|uniref:Uncharacterized protein n=1 Tax=Riccia fluitans TaxID=41844 RepID=A0ABD1Y256_9MARC
MRGTVSTVIMMYTLLLLIGVAIFLLMRIIRTRISSLILLAGDRKSISEEKPNGETVFAPEQACAYAADHIIDLRDLHDEAWTVTSSPHVGFVNCSIAAINTTALADIDGKTMDAALLASLHLGEEAEQVVAVAVLPRSPFYEEARSGKPLPSDSYSPFAEIE